MSNKLVKFVYDQIVVEIKILDRTKRDGMYHVVFAGDPDSGDRQYTAVGARTLKEAMGYASDAAQMVRNLFYGDPIDKGLQYSKDHRP